MLDAMTPKLIITKTVSIPLSELEFRFARGSGPGGQNVNKVETRVELLFDAAHSPSLTNETREMVFHSIGSRIDANGILHLVVGTSRSQWKNRQEAIKRFLELMQKALTPKKKRVKTKLPQVAKQKRLEQKKRRGENIRMRRIIPD